MTMTADCRACIARRANDDSRFCAMRARERVRENTRKTTSTLDLTAPPTYILIDDQMISNQLEIEILNWRSSAGRFRAAHSIDEIVWI